MDPKATQGSKTVSSVADNMQECTGDERQYPHTGSLHVPFKLMQ